MIPTNKPDDETGVQHRELNEPCTWCGNEGTYHFVAGFADGKCDECNRSLPLKHPNGG